jgi:hypothetical protein
VVLIGITGLMVAVVTVYFLRLFTTFDIFATFECIRTGQVHSNGTGAFERGSARPPLLNPCRHARLSGTSENVWIWPPKKKRNLILCLTLVVFVALLNQQAVTFVSPDIEIAVRDSVFDETI